MKKKLIIILAIPFLLLFFNHKSFFEIIIEKRISKLTEHKVNLNLIRFNLFSGELKLEDIKIINKEDFYNQYIFKAKQIIIDLDSNSYFDELVKIKTVTFDEPKIFFEIKNFEEDNKKNIKDNLEILNKISNQKKPKIYPKKSKDKNFIIKNLKINNAIAYIKYENLENLVIPLSKMEFKNVGNSGNSEIKFQHYKDIMKFIMGDIFFRIPNKNIRKLIKENYKIK